MPTKSWSKERELSETTRAQTNMHFSTTLILMPWNCLVHIKLSPSANRANMEEGLTMGPSRVATMKGDEYGTATNIPGLRCSNGGTRRVADSPRGCGRQAP